MTEKLTPGDRQLLAYLFELITTGGDSDIVTELKAGKGKYRHLLNADITVEACRLPSCRFQYERGMPDECRHTLTLDWTLNMIQHGRCDHSLVHSCEKWMSLRLVHQAVYKGHPQTTRFLLTQTGGDVECETARYKHTPLEVATEYNRIEIAKTLIFLGANINGSNRHSPLLTAVCRGHDEMCKVLLQSGADPNMTPSGTRFLDEALYFDWHKVVQVLVEYKADVSVINLGVAANSACAKCMDVVISAGGNPNGISNGLPPPLFTAVANCYIDLVRCLLRYNVNLEISRTKGYVMSMTPMFFAVKYRSLEIVGDLLEAGYDIWRENWLLEKLDSPDNTDTDRLGKHLLALRSTPPSLKHRCKMVIRKLCGTRLNKSLDQLYLPDTLRNYIVFNATDDVNKLVLDNI